MDTNAMPSARPAVFIDLIMFPHSAENRRKLVCLRGENAVGLRLFLEQETSRDRAFTGASGFPRCGKDINR